MSANPPDPNAAVNGLTRSAILLMSLGEEQAAEVFKHLSAKEVQKLGPAIAALGKITQEQVDAVLDTFAELAGDRGPFEEEPPEFARRVLVRALGENKADLLLERDDAQSVPPGIEGLKWMEPAGVAQLIKSEHPQVIAAILVHLERDQAGKVLRELGERLRDDVMLRIATLDAVQPAALRELDDALAKLLNAPAAVASKKTTLGGVRAAAEILNNAGKATESAALEAIRTHDEALAQEIVDEMFVFDDLMALDDRAIQTVLREVQSESLIIALKGASPALRERIFKNMSARAAEMLREDLESKGPVRLAEVEAEQKEIVKTARALAEDGTINMPGGGDDSFV